MPTPRRQPRQDALFGYPLLAQTRPKSLGSHATSAQPLPRTLSAHLVACPERRLPRSFAPLRHHRSSRDGPLHQAEELFRKRVRKINEYARTYRMAGFRAGAMHRNQEWFDLLEFQYDMSVPTVSHLEPQRGGCCTVMPYFVGNLLELPLTTVQDHSLFYVLRECSIDLWQRLGELFSAHYGLIRVIL